MAEAVLKRVGTGILGSMVGLVCGKTYDSLEGEEMQKNIVGNSTGIKRKAEWLGLKDLRSSESLFKDGMVILDLACKDLKPASEGQAEDSILNDVLSFYQAVKKSPSKKRFLSAKLCFLSSCERSTYAFHNGALSIKDRIMACKLRIAARILESGLEDPEAAITICHLSLKELHGLPAIQDMFSVYLNGGFRSWFWKAKRLEIIMSVLFINHALFDFAAKYGSEYPNVFTWPGIELTDRTFNPILNTQEILAKTSTRVSEELVQQLYRTIADERLRLTYFAVNSRGEVIRLDHDKITDFNSTDESKDDMFPNPIAAESNLVEQEEKAVAVDCDDNVYVVRWRKTRDENEIKENYVLSVFDENYVGDCFVLDFLDAKKQKDTDVKIAVDKNKNLIIIKENDNKVYTCDNAGQLKFTPFERKSRLAYSLTISDKNDIVIPSDDRSAVHIYTTEGIKSRTKIELPGSHKVWLVASHHGICKIIVLACIEACIIEQNSWSLLSYSEKGVQENSVSLLVDLCQPCSWWGLKMASYPSGLVAFKQKDSVTFI